MSSPSTNYSYVPYQVMDPDNGLRATLLRYLRHWYWFALAAGLMLSAAFLYLRYAQPVYLSQSRLLIKDEKKGLDSESILKDLEIFAPKKVIENETEILRSFTLMEQVVNQLGLDVQYTQDTPSGRREVFRDSPVRLIIEKADPELYQDEPIELSFPDAKTVQMAGQSYPLNTSVQTPFGRLRFFGKRAISSSTEPVFMQVSPRDEVVTGYLQALKAEPTSKASTVILLSIETGVPDKGEAILNRLIDVYTEASVLDKNRVASNTLNFIEERLQLVSGELQSVEKGVEAYKSAQGITDLGTEAQGFLETAQQNDANLTETNIQLAALDGIQQYVNSQPEYRSGTPATLGLSDPTLVKLIETFTKLDAQRQELARTTAEQNPLMETVNSQLKTIKSSIAENIGTMRKTLTSTRQQFRAKNQKIEGAIRTIPTKERNLMNITRQQVIKNDLYTYLLRKREETAVSYASAISDSRVIDAARTAKKPVKPRKQLIYLFFLLGGLLMPALVLGAYDAINNRVVRRSDVEDATQVPILGEVVQKKQPGILVVASRSQTVIAEQIRILRTNLNYLRNNREGSQVLLFTSSVEGEGKTFISLNLGASLALVGQRTVILEMDLRKPKLHESIGFPNGLGLSDYLAGDTTLSQIVNPIPDSANYSIVTSGSLPPNPAELLSSPRLEQLISELRHHFDYILIDAPPIGLVTDAQLIAPFADATLYIIRHDVTPKNSLKMVEMLFREKRFNKLNIVLNAVRNDATTYYSYGGNRYGTAQSSDQLATAPKKSFLKRFRPNA